MTYPSTGLKHCYSFPARGDRHDRRMTSSLIAAISGRRARRACADRQVGDNPGRARVTTGTAVAKANRVSPLVGNQQREHGTVVHQDGNLIAQPGGEGASSEASGSSRMRKSGSTANARARATRRARTER